MCHASDYPPYSEDPAMPCDHLHEEPTFVPSHIFNLHNSEKWMIPPDSLAAKIDGRPCKIIADAPGSKYTTWVQFADGTKFPAREDELTPISKPEPEPEPERKPLYTIVTVTTTYLYEG